MEGSVENLVRAVEAEVKTKWLFKNFEIYSSSDDSRISGHIFDFKKVKAIIYTDGDIEIDSPIFQRLREKYDYRNIDEALLWLHQTLKDLDENYKEFEMNPDLWQKPLFNRLFDWIRSSWKNPKNEK